MIMNDCRVHIITPFLRLDWKLADDAQTEPIRHFQDLLMDLLVGRATECLLIRRSAREGGRGPLSRVAPSPAIFPLRLTSSGVTCRYL